jgi:TRAP-type transport system small permease protein
VENAMTRLTAFVDTILVVVCCSLLAVMAGLVGAQVFARYLAGNALPWSEELARHLMIWMLFLGAALALRRGAHLGIDALVERTTPRMQAGIRLLVGLILAGFALLMVQQGIILSQRTMGQRASGLGYPMGYVYMAVPVGGGLLLLMAIDGMRAEAAALLGRGPQGEGDAP